MLTAEKSAMSEDYREIPAATTCFKLNKDGSYEPSYVDCCSVYIDEAQVFRIWDPQVASFIRENYGPYVGVMHTEQREFHIPVYPTFKCVLGG